MNDLVTNIWCWFGDNTAEVIAFCALFFTAYQTYATRMHNKLSVKPHLSESFDKILNPKDGVFNFVISNNGLGPAEITEWKALLNSVEIKFTEHTSVESAIKNLLKDRRFNYSIGTLGSGYVMSTNERKNVLSINCQIKDEEDFISVEKELNKLDLIVKYKSMYGNKYKLDTRDK